MRRIAFLQSTQRDRRPGPLKRLLNYYAVSEARESWPRSRREIEDESVIRRVFRNAGIGQEAAPQVGGVFQQPLGESVLDYGIRGSHAVQDSPISWRFGSRHIPIIPLFLPTNERFPALRPPS